MKKMSELMDELGFDPEGSTAVKEAFIKYLIKSGAGMSVLTPTEKALITANPEKVKSIGRASEPDKQTQMQFEFMDEPRQRSAKKSKIS